MSNIQYCNIHNEPFIFYSKNQQGLCIYCAEDKLGDGVMSVDKFKSEIQNQQNQLLRNATFEIVNTKETLEQLFDQLQKFKQQILTGVDKLLQSIFQQIKIAEQYREKYTRQWDYKSENLKMLQSDYKNQIQYNKDLKNQINQQLLEIQQRTRMDQFFTYLNKIQHESESIIQSKIKIVEQSNDQRKFLKDIIQQDRQNFFRLEHQIIKQSMIEQKETCRTFAFNKEQTLLIVGCGKEIIIYEFQNGILSKEIQRLNLHKNDITCLYFMENTFQFMSASKDQTIKLWAQNNNLKWNLFQNLHHHTDWINVMIINKAEDLIISGSDDKTVVFWNKENYQWRNRQTIQVYKSILAMSLSPTQTKLVACGYDTIIQVFEQQKDQSWIVSQTIDVKEHGFRLCFISANQFVFQPYIQGHLEIYSFHQQKQQFQKHGQIKINKESNCEIFFPSQFISAKNMIIVKHGRNINFFQLLSKNEIKFEIQIQFFDDIFYGTVSPNGQFLVTWDSDSKTIQIRKFNYIN